MTREQLQTWAARLVAVLVLVNGLWAINRPLLERIPERFEMWLVPLGVDYASRALDVVLGVTLLYMSYQLWQRKIVAWSIAVGGLGLLSGVNLVASHNLATGLMPAASAVVLGLARPYFRSHSEQTKVWQGLLVFGASLTLAIAYGTAGFWLMEKRDFGQELSLRQAAVYSLREYALVGVPQLTPHSRYARWFLDSLGLLGASSLLFGLYSLFRPLAYRYRAQPAERGRMEALLMHHSVSADDFFKLWPHDKSYEFLADGGAGLAYGVASGIAVSVGDPVGPERKIGPLVRGFGLLCERNGWRPCFMYVGDRYRTTYTEAGYELIGIGEDAVVNLERFAADTVRNKHFRNIHNRFEREGYTVEVYQPPHDPALLRQIVAVSADWMRRSDRQEWRFLAGSFSTEYMKMGPLWVARDKQGRVEAFANQIPTYLEGWASIDLMRYRERAPKNMMDYLLMMILLQLHEQGVKQFNLGLAPLSGLDTSAGRPEERLLTLVYRSNQRLVSLQGLRRFKAKFDPEWERKYVAYTGGVGQLPRLAYAVSKLMRVS